MILSLKDILDKEKIAPYGQSLSKHLSIDPDKTTPTLLLAMEGIVLKLAQSVHSANPQVKGLLNAWKSEEPKSGLPLSADTAAAGQSIADSIFTHYEWDQLRNKLKEGTNITGHEASQIANQAVFIVKNGASAEWTEDTTFEDQKTVLAELDSGIWATDSSMTSVFKAKNKEDFIDKIPFSSTAKKILKEEPKKEWMKILPFVILGILSASALFAIRHSEWGAGMHNAVLEANDSDTASPHLHIFEQDVEQVRLSSSRSLTVPRNSYVIDMIEDLRANDIDLRKGYLADEIIFESGQAALSQFSQSAISNLSAVLTEFPDNRIRLIGHCDESISEAENNVLSEQRALSVKGALMEAGIEEDRLITVGCGDEYLRMDSTGANYLSTSSMIELNILPNR